MAHHGSLAPFLTSGVLLLGMGSSCRNQTSTTDGVDTEATTDGETGGTDDAELLTISLNGAAAKGPLLLGSAVDVAVLGPTLAPTGQVFRTQTLNDLGEFQLELMTSDAVALEAQGFYFNEVTGDLSDAPLTLRAYYEPTGQGLQSAYVNMVSHLAAPRIARLVGDGTSFADAVTQSEAEVRAASGVGVAGFDPAAAPTEMNLLGGDTDANAYLFAVSAVITQAAVTRAGGPGGPVDAHLQEILNAMGQTLGDLGQISPTLHQELLGAQQALDTATVKVALERRFDELGAGVPVPDIDRIIDSDLDGVPNAYDNCPHDANPDQTDTDGNGIGDVCECGNGVVNHGEECDDGNAVPQDGCEPDCRLTCSTVEEGTGTIAHHVMGAVGDTVLWASSEGNVIFSTQARTVDGSTEDLGIIGGNVVHALGTSFILGPQGVFVTDGTAAGTVQVGPAGSPDPTIVFDGRLWYAGTNGGVWASDGTSEGTAQVVSARPLRFAVFDDRLYFRTMQAQLWWSDGTSVGTEVIDEVSEWEHWDTPQLLLSAANGLVFDSDALEGTPIMVSNGQPGEATHVPLDIGLTSFHGAVVNGMARLVVCGGMDCSVVQSDGTIEGTEVLTSVEVGFDDPPPVIPVGNLMFFTPIAFFGGALWVTDGTTAGTVQIGANNTLSAALGATDPWLWFVGRATPGAGWELWRTDGSATNTIPVVYLESHQRPFVPFTEGGAFATGSSWVFFSAHVTAPGGEIDSVIRCRIPD